MTWVPKNRSADDGSDKSDNENDDPNSTTEISPDQNANNIMNQADQNNIYSSGGFYSNPGLTGGGK